jgi:hypothetical protein
VQVSGISPCRFVVLKLSVHVIVCHAGAMIALRRDSLRSLSVMRSMAEAYAAGSLLFAQRQAFARKGTVPER